MTAQRAITVMLVDDQEDVRFLLRSILASENGIDISAEASSGEEALAVLADIDPDALILDAKMPGLDGLETAARALAARPAQRVVLCSATFDPAVWDGARTAGVAACLSKDDLFGLPGVVRGVLGGA